MIAKFICNFFFPRRDLIYFELYFEFWERITRKPGGSNCPEAWLIRLMIGLSILEALKYAYLVTLYHPSITTRLLLYDGFSLLMPNQLGMSFMTFAGIVMIIRLTILTYFKGEHWAFESLRDMILRNRATTFLWRDGNPLEKVKNRRNVCDHLIFYIKILLPGGQIITVFVCKF